MRVKIPIISAGIVLLTFGIIFFLQGNSIVGPTSSFMYSNPRWIAYGQWIAVKQEWQFLQQELVLAYHTQGHS